MGSILTEFNMLVGILISVVAVAAYTFTRISRKEVYRNLQSKESCELIVQAIKGQMENIDERFSGMASDIKDIQKDLKHVCVTVGRIEGTLNGEGDG